MTTKRILAMIIALLIMVSVLTSCELVITKTDEAQTHEGESEEQQIQEEEELETWGTFNVISKTTFRYSMVCSVTQYYVYDTETYVEYVIFVIGEDFECTPLYNPDGTLKLYNPNNAGAN